MFNRDVGLKYTNTVYQSMRKLLQTKCDCIYHAFTRSKFMIKCDKTCTREQNCSI